MTTPCPIPRVTNMTLLLRSIIFGCLLSLIFPASNLAAATKSPPKAEYFFRELPTSIFDNTNSPLTEEEKEFLLELGYCSTWMIKTKTPDLLVLSAMSIEKSEVQVRVFRGASGGGLVALSAIADQECATELWGFNPKGGLVPYEMQEEPEAKDFFKAGVFLPPTIGFSYSLCLRDKYLEAKPSFWNASGPLDTKPDNDILYTWQNDSLEKSIVPRTDLKNSKEQ